MDLQSKVKLKNELTIIKSILPTVTGMTAGLNQSTFPVAGPMVMIPALPQAAQAIKLQNDCVMRIVALIEKVIEES